MAEELKSLIRVRGSHKSKLTIFKAYLEPLLSCKALSSLQLHELNTRLTKIQALYDDFDANQTQIENSNTIPDDDFAERQNFESTYFGAIAAAQDLLSRHSAGGGRPSGSNDLESVAGSNVASPTPNIKLPTINLPLFSGRYQDWLEYRDTYLSLIHENSSIPNIHKFHYLRASLRDSAALIIQSLDFSSDNYDIAWDLLCNRYNNNRILINNHVQTLFNIDPITKESARALRNIIDVVSKNLRSLKSLNVPTEHWDILIIHIVSNKLDPATIRDWESQRNTIKELPTFNDFLNFLKNRADLLETMDEKHRQPFRRHSDITHVRQRSFIANPTPTKPTQFPCPICKMSHSIYYCMKFKQLSIEKRIERVKQLKLCINCLRSGHDEKKCTYGACKLCSRRHNTMLHLENKQNTQPNTQSQTDCVVLPTMQEHRPTEPNI